MNTLKITGTAELPERLEFGKEYAVGFIGAITDVKKKDLNNGSYEYRHALKMIGAKIEIRGKKIPLKIKGSSSKRRRDAMWYGFNELGIEGDFNEVYEDYKEVVIRNPKKFWELYINLTKEE